jgi:hypothetical protein
MTQAQTHNLEWNGITLEIEVEADQISSRISGEEYNTIKVRSLQPLNAALPLAERGFYRDSVAAATLRAAGGAVAYVDVMLAAA